MYTHIRLDNLLLSAIKIQLTSMNSLLIEKYIWFLIVLFLDKSVHSDDEIKIEILVVRIAIAVFYSI